LKRVLLIHSILWSHYKAAVFSELSNILAKEDIDFHVIQIATNSVTRLNIGNVDHKIHDYSYEVLFDDPLENISWVKKYRLLSHSINRFDPDVLILPGYGDISSMLINLKYSFKRIKLIQTVDTTPEGITKRWFKELIKKFLLKKVDVIYCYGQLHKEYLLSLGVKESKIVIRCQATFNDKIREKYLSNESMEKLSFPTKNNFLFVGRLLWYKNLSFLIEVFNELNTDWGLIIVGDGILEKELIKIKEDLNLENVYFEGPKTSGEVIDYYRYCDAFILPSTVEIWGLVVNEAMLCELPLLLSSHCGCSKDLLRENENGYLFDPHKANEMVNCFNKIILKSDEERNLMGKLSYEIIKNFTPRIAAEQMFEGIKKVL